MSQSDQSEYPELPADLVAELEQMSRKELAIALRIMRLAEIEPPRGWEERAVARWRRARQP